MTITEVLYLTGWARSPLLIVSFLAFLATIVLTVQRSNRPRHRVAWLLPVAPLASAAPFVAAHLRTLWLARTAPDINPELRALLVRAEMSELRATVALASGLALVILSTAVFASAARVALRANPSR